MLNSPSYGHGIYTCVDLATLPTLLVPYENSLTEDVESRYKALTDAKVSP